MRRADANALLATAGAGFGQGAATRSPLCPKPSSTGCLSQRGWTRADSSTSSGKLQNGVGRLRTGLWCGGRPNHRGLEHLPGIAAGGGAVWRRLGRRTQPPATQTTIIRELIEEIGHCCCHERWSPRFSLRGDVLVRVAGRSLWCRRRGRPGRGRARGGRRVPHCPTHENLQPPGPRAVSVEGIRRD